MQTADDGDGKNLFFPSPGLLDWTLEVNCRGIKLSEIGRLIMGHLLGLSLRDISKVNPMS